VQLRQRWERLREALSMGWKEICATPKMRYKSRVLKHNRKEDRNQEFHSHHEKAGIQMQTEWKKRNVNIWNEKLLENERGPSTRRTKF
jgi:hypothetical protein